MDLGPEFFEIREHEDDISLSLTAEKLFTIANTVWGRNNWTHTVELDRGPQSRTLPGRSGLQCVEVTCTCTVTHQQTSHTDFATCVGRHKYFDLAYEMACKLAREQAVVNAFKPFGSVFGLDMNDEQFIKQLLLKDVPTRNVLKEETTFHHPKYNPNKLIVRATPAGSSQAPTSETSVIKQRITSAFQPESSSATSSSYGMSNSTFFAKFPASQKQTKRKSIMQSPAADDDNDDDDDDQDFQTPPKPCLYAAIGCRNIW